MNKFTIRIKPYNGESLFSFIIRLGNKNGLGFLATCNLFKTSQDDYFQSSEAGILNFVPSNHININKLSKAVGVDEKYILKTTLFFSIYTFCEDSEAERARFVSGLLNNKFRYCSSCLNEKNYHKLLWCINNIDICIEHKIKLKDKCLRCNNILYLEKMTTTNICPYCGFDLRSIIENEKLSSENLEFSRWITETWETLLFNKHRKLKNDETAMKVLYILNNYEMIFDRNIIKINSKLYSCIETLLQHARNSLSINRKIHFSILFRILHENNVSMEEFIDLKVPCGFVKSVMAGITIKKDKVSCLAPWCVNYNIVGTLTKTGTTFKSNSRGKTLLYYLICPECGCEYAFDTSQNLIERSYFIESYKKLKKIWHKELCLTEIADALNISLDKTKRCLAYFNVRDMFVGRASYNDRFLINQEYIKIFKESIERNTNMKKIEKWGIWKSYREFLLYRYNTSIMRALMEQSRKRGLRTDRSANAIILKQVLEDMLSKDVNITISSVCNQLNVSPETIRQWNCNLLISKMKELQKSNRYKQRKEMLYTKIQEYLGNNQNRAIRSKDIYKHIQVIRTVLWREYPEVTKFITEEVKKVNKK